MTKSEALQVAKPILFNTEMVRAIQNGKKTTERRLIKPKYDNTHIEIIKNKYGRQLVEIQNEDDVKVTVNPDGTHCRQLRAMQEITAPYKVGDILYVRETWSPVSVKPKRYLYKTHCSEAEGLPVKWHPSIHMPKEAARIFLRVARIWVEKLKDVSENEAISEGFSSRAEFVSAITKMYPNCSEEDWFWVIEFEKLEVTR